MSDAELLVQEDQELSMEMFDPDAMAPDVKTTDVPRMPRISIVQSTSQEAKKAGAKEGQFVIDWKDPTRPAIFVDTLRVWLIDIIDGRVMFAFQSNGKPDRASKEPWCASSDGEKPRAGQVFNYIGKTIRDWRTKQDVVIQDTCEGCPLSKFITTTDDDGKKVNQGPPCQESPQFVLWLVDQGFPAIFQSSAPTVRNRLVGQPRKGYPGLAKFFKPNGVDMATGKNTYPNIQDGKWKSVKVTTKLEVHNSGNETYVPVLDLDATPLELMELKQIFDSKKYYETPLDGVTMREVLSGQAYELDNPVDDTAVEKERLTPPGMKGGNLGSGPKEDRRMGKKKKDADADDEGDAY